MFKALFGVLQKIGRALMLPVAILLDCGDLACVRECHAEQRYDSSHAFLKQ